MLWLSWNKMSTRKDVKIMLMFVSWAVNVNEHSATLSSETCSACIYLIKSLPL